MSLYSDEVPDSFREIIGKNIDITYNAIVTSCNFDISELHNLEISEHKIFGNSIYFECYDNKYYSKYDDNVDFKYILVTACGYYKDDYNWGFKYVTFELAKNNDN